MERNKELQDIIALSKLVDEFSGLMRKRLIKKYYEGFSGWENIPVDCYKERIVSNIQNNDFVDAANLAMFANFKKNE